MNIAGWIEGERGMPSGFLLALNARCHSLQTRTRPTPTEVSRGEDHVDNLVVRSLAAAYPAHLALHFHRRSHALRDLLGRLKALLSHLLSVAARQNHSMDGDRLITEIETAPRNRSGSN
jgi:hypothetical protein